MTPFGLNPLGDIAAQIATLPPDERRRVIFPVLAWQRLAPFASWATWGSAGSGPGDLQTEAVRLALDELASIPDGYGADTLDRVRTAPKDVRERMLRGAAYRLSVAVDALGTKVLDAMGRRTALDTATVFTFTFGTACQDNGAGMMLAADAVFAGWLPTLATADEEFNADLRVYAAKVEAAAVERWRAFTTGASDAKQLDMFPDPRIALWGLWVQSPNNHGWTEIGASKLLRNVARYVVRAAVPGWRDELVQIERAQHMQPGLPAPLFAATLQTQGARVGAVFQAQGKDFRALDMGDRTAVHVDVGALPEGVARSLAGGGAFPWSVAHYRVLSLVVNELRRAIDTGETWTGPTVRPVVRIPRGKALATALGMAADGPSGRQADEAVSVVSSLRFQGPDGPLALFTLEGTGIARAPGRAGAWDVTIGRALLPLEVAKMPKNQPDWRRLVPYPDELPDPGWVGNRRRYGDATRAALALPLLWRTAAGAEHGKRWSEQPGVVLTRSAWNEHADGLDMARALDAWGAEGWIEVAGGLVVPGPKLPRLRAMLDGAAEGARKQHRQAAKVKRRISNTGG